MASKKHKDSKKKKKFNSGGAFKSYAKNLGKSALLLGKDLMFDQEFGLTSVEEMIRDNQELAEQGIAAYKDRENIFKMIKDTVDKQVFSQVRDLKKNVISDLKTGNLYNKSREDKEFMQSFAGEDMLGDDFFDDLDDFGSDLKGSVDSSLSDFGDELSSGISDSLSSFSNDIVRSNTKSAVASINADIKMHKQSMEGMSVINDAVSSIATFNDSRVSPFLDKAMEYYDKSLELAERRNQLLEEMVNAATQEQEENDDRSSAERAMGWNYGTFNVKEYANAVKQSTFNVLSEITGMDFSDIGGTMGGGNMIKGIIANPIGGAIHASIVKVLPSAFKEASKELNKTISSFFPALMLKLSDIAENSFGTVKGFMARIFGLEFKDANRVDLGGYEKGKVNFDGITKKTIVDVIPTYLRKILSAITKSDELVFDRTSGKFTTLSAAKKAADEVTESSFMDYSDTKNKIKGHVASTTDMTSEQTANFERLIDDVFESISKNVTGLVDRKLDFKKLKGVDATDAEAEMLSRAFQALSKSDMMNLQREHAMSKRNRAEQVKDFNKNMESHLGLQYFLTEDVDKLTNTGSYSPSSMANYAQKNKRVKMNDAVAKSVKFKAGMAVDKDAQERLDRERAWQEAHKRDPKLKKEEFLREYDGNSDLKNSVMSKVPGMEGFKKTTDSFLKGVQKIISKPFAFLEKQFKKFDSFLYDVIFDSDFVKTYKEKMSNFFTNMKEKVFGVRDDDGSWGKMGFLSSTRDIFRDFGNKAANFLWGKEYTDKDGNLIEKKEKPVFGVIKAKFTEYTTKAKNFLFGEKDAEGNILKTGFLTQTKDKFVDLVERTKIYLFGEKDDEGNVISGKEGVIPEKYQKMFKRFAPKAGIGAGAGLLASLFMPFGGMVGAFGGAAVGAILEMDKVKDFLWGKENEDGKRENGIFTKAKNKLQETMTRMDKYLFGENKEGAYGVLGMSKEKAGKGIGIGAGAGLIGSLFLPGGPFLGTLLGAATGFASQTKKFQQFLFGDGKSDKKLLRNGLIPTAKDFIVNDILNPIRDYAVGSFRYVRDFVNTKLVVPFNLAFKPIMVEAGLQIKRTFKNITSFVKNLWTGFMDSMSEKMNDLFGSASKRFILAPLGNYFKDKLEAIGDFVGRGLKKPMQKLNEFAGRLREKHIAQGNDGYMAEGTKYGALLKAYHSRNENDDWKNMTSMKGSHADYIKQATADREKKHEEWVARNGGFNPFSKDYKVPKKGKKTPDQLTQDEISSIKRTAMMSDEEAMEGIKQETEYQANRQIDEKRDKAINRFGLLAKGNQNALRDISSDPSASRTEKITAFMSDKVSSISTHVTGIFEYIKQIAKNTGGAEDNKIDQAMLNAQDADRGIDKNEIYSKAEKKVTTSFAKNRSEAKKVADELGLDVDRSQTAKDEYLESVKATKVASAREEFLKANDGTEEGRKKALAIQAATEKKYGGNLDFPSLDVSGKKVETTATTSSTGLVINDGKAGKDVEELTNAKDMAESAEREEKAQEAQIETAKNTSILGQFAGVFKKGTGWLWGFASKALKWGAAILPIVAIGKKIYDFVKNFKNASQGASNAVDAAGNFFVNAKGELQKYANSRGSRVGELLYDTGKILINPITSPKLNRAFAQGTVKTAGAVGSTVKSFMGKSPYLDALKTSFNPLNYTKSGKALGNDFMERSVKNYMGQGNVDDIAKKLVAEAAGNAGVDASSAFATKQTSKLASKLGLKQAAIKEAGGELSEKALAKYSPNWFAKSLNAIANSKVAQKYLGGTKLGSKALSEISQEAAKSASKAMAKEGTERVGMELATKLAGPLVNGALFGVDMARGYNEANRILNLPSDYNPTFRMKASAALGKGFSELLLGLVNPGWIAERVYNVIGSNEDKLELQKQQEALALEAGVTLEALYSDDAEISKAAKAQLKGYSESVNKTAMTKLGDWTKTDGGKTAASIAAKVAAWKIPGLSGAVSFVTGAADGKKTKENLGMLSDASLGITGRLAGGFAQQLQTLTFGVFKYTDTIHGIHGITLLLKDGLVKIKDGIVSVCKWFGNLPENLAKLVDNWEDAISGALSGTRLEFLTRPIISAINGIANAFQFAYDSVKYVFGGIAKTFGLDHLWKKAEARSAQEVSKKNLEALKNRMSTDVGDVGTNKLSGFNWQANPTMAGLDTEQKENLVNYASNYTEGVDVIQPNSLDASYGLTADTIRSVVNTSKNYNAQQGITDNSSINVESLANDQVKAAYAIESQRAEMYAAISQGDTDKVQELAGSDTGKLLMENDEEYRKLVEKSNAMIASMNEEKDPIPLGKKIGMGIVGGVLALPIAKMFIPVGKSILSTFKVLATPLQAIARLVAPKLFKNKATKEDKSPIGKIKNAFVGEGGVVPTMKRVLEETGEALINKIAKMQGYDRNDTIKSNPSGSSPIKNATTKSNQLLLGAGSSTMSQEEYDTRKRSIKYERNQTVKRLQSDWQDKKISDEVYNNELRKANEKYKKDMDELAKNVSKSTNEAAKDIKKSGNTVSDSVKDVGEDIKKSSKKAKKDVDKGANDVSKSVKDTGEDIKKSSKKAKKDIDTGANEISSTTKKKGQSIKDACTDMKNKVSKGFTDFTNKFKKSGDKVSKEIKQSGSKVSNSAQKSSVQVDNAGKRVSTELIELGTDVQTAGAQSTALINSTPIATGGSTVAKAGLLSKIGSGFKSLASTKGGKVGLIVGGIAIAGGITAAIVNGKKKAETTKIEELSAEEKEAAKRILNNLNNGTITTGELSDAEIALLQAYKSALANSSKSKINKVASVASTGALGYTASGLADSYLSSQDSSEMEELDSYLSEVGADNIPSGNSSSNKSGMALSLAGTLGTTLMYSGLGSKAWNGIKGKFGKTAGKKVAENAGKKASNGLFKGLLSKFGGKAASKAVGTTASKTASKGIFKGLLGKIGGKAAASAVTGGASSAATGAAAAGGSGLLAALGPAAAIAAGVYAVGKGVSGAVNARDIYGLSDNQKVTGGMRAASALTNIIPFLSDETKKKWSTNVYGFFAGKDKKDALLAAQNGVSKSEYKSAMRQKATNEDAVKKAEFELETKMDEVMTSRLESSKSAMAELDKQKEIGEDLKNDLLEVSKGTLNEAVVTAWTVANSNALTKWKQALGVDKKFNFLSGVKDVVKGAAKGVAFGVLGGPIGMAIGGAVGAVSTLWKKFDKATTVDDTAARSVQSLTDKTMETWEIAFENSLPIYDTIDNDTIFKSPNGNGEILEDSLKQIATSGMSEAIATGWAVSNDNALKKFKQALGIDTKFNVLRGIKGFISSTATGAVTGGMFGGAVGGIGGGILGSIGGALVGGTSYLWDKFDKATTVDESVAEVVNNLTTKTLDVWKNKFSQSTGFLDEIQNTDIFAEDNGSGLSLKDSLLSVVKTSMSEGLATVWTIASDNALKKFKQALGVDTKFNVLKGIKEFITSGVKGAAVGGLYGGVTGGVGGGILGAVGGALVGGASYLWNKFDEATTVDEGIAGTVQTISTQILSAWKIQTEKISSGWVQNNILNDANLLSDSGLPEELKELTRKGLGDAVKLLWKESNSLAYEGFKEAIQNGTQSEWWDKALHSPITKTTLTIIGGLLGGGLGASATIGAINALDERGSLVQNITNMAAPVISSVSTQMNAAWMDKFQWIAGGDGYGDGWVKKIVTDDTSFLSGSEIPNDLKAQTQESMGKAINLLWKESNSLAYEGFKEAIQNQTQSEWWDKALHSPITKTALTFIGGLLGGGLGASATYSVLNEVDERGSLVDNIVNMATPSISAISTQLTAAWVDKFQWIAGGDGYGDGWVKKIVTDDDSFLSGSSLPSDLKTATQEAMGEVAQLLWKESNNLAKQAFKEATLDETQSHWWDKVNRWFYTKTGADLGETYTYDKNGNIESTEKGKSASLVDSVMNQAVGPVAQISSNLTKAWVDKFQWIAGGEGYGDGWVKKIITDDTSFLSGSNIPNDLKTISQEAMGEVVSKLWKEANDIAKQGFTEATNDTNESHWYDKLWGAVTSIWGGAGSDRGSYINAKAEEFAPIVASVSNNISNAWKDKFQWIAGGDGYGDGWVKQLITNDETFLQSSQGEVKALMQDSTSEVLTKLVESSNELATDIWKKAINTVANKSNSASSSALSFFGATKNETLTEEEMSTYSGVISAIENVNMAVNSLWTQQANGIANIISGGSINGNIFNADDVSSFQDSVLKNTDEISSYNDTIKTDINSYSTLSSLFRGGNFNGSFAGFKKFIFFTKRLSIMTPVVMKQISEGISSTYNSIGSSLNSVGSTLDSSISSAKSSISRVSSSSSAASFFSNRPSSSGDFAGLNKAAYYMAKLMLFPVYMIKTLSKKLEGSYENISVKWANVSITSPGGWGGFGRDENYLGDSRLANKPYAGSTLAKAGCGPIAASKALRNIGMNASVEDVANYATAKGYANGNIGTDSNFIAGLSQETGVGVNSFNGNDQKSLDEALASGKQVIANGSNFRDVNMPYTSRGHYVNILGKKGDKYFVENTNGTSGLYSWKQIGHMSGSDPNEDWEGARQFYALSGAENGRFNKTRYFGGDTSYTKAELALANVMKSTQEKLDYTQGDKRTNIPGGWSDCSSLTWWIYKNLLGMDIGTSTWTSINKGKTVASNGKSDEGLRPGDLVFYKGYNSKGNEIQHVEMITGPNGEMMGHGSGIGPKVHNVKTYSWINGGKGYYVVKRHDINGINFNPLNIAARDCKGNPYTITSGDVSSASNSSSTDNSGNSENTTTSSGRQMSNFTSKLSESIGNVSKEFLKQYGIEDISKFATDVGNVFLNIADPEIITSSSSDSSSSTSSSSGSGGLKSAIAKKLFAITNGAEGGYDTVIPNDNGSWSVGIAGFHGTAKIKPLFNDMAAKLSGNAKSQALKFAGWGSKILSTSEANEVKSFLQANSAVSKEVQDAHMNAIVDSNMSTPVSMYNAGELKDYRSIIIAADIGNTGPAHLTDWRKNYRPTSQSSELAHVRDSLRSTDSWWGRQSTGKNSKYYNGWMNRISNTHNAVANWQVEGYDPATSPSLNGGSGFGGFGSGSSRNTVHFNKYSGFGPNVSTTPSVQMSDYRTDISDDINKTLSAIKVAKEQGATSTSAIDAIIAYLKAIEENTRNTSSNTAASNGNEVSIISALEKILNLNNNPSVNNSAVVVAEGGDTSNQLHTKEVQNIFANHGITDETEAQKVNDKLRKIADLIAKGK